MTGSKQHGISSRQLIERTGISFRQLDYWERTGIVTPSVQRAKGSGTKRGWSEIDALYVGAIKAFLDAGLVLEMAVERAKRDERVCPVCRGTGIDRRGGQTMPRRDTSELDKVLTPFYESGERVEIEWQEGYGGLEGQWAFRTNGRQWRGFIGRSTGWRPVYLFLPLRSSSGGLALSPGTMERAVAVRGLRVFRR